MFRLFLVWCVSVHVVSSKFVDIVSSDDPQLDTTINSGFTQLNNRDHLAKYNDALAQAISAVQKDQQGDDAGQQAVVLDIDSGAAAIASMMAARLGANQVYAVERNRAAAQVSHEIIENNGFHDKITVYRGSSLNITSLPTKANVLFVAHLLQASLFGASLPRIVRHARRHLLTDGALSIPSRALVFCQLVATYYSFEENTLIQGFNMEPLRQYREANAHTQDISSIPYRNLSDVHHVMDFDFQGEQPISSGRQWTVEVTSDGTVSSLVLWWDAQLAQGIHVSNSPAEAGFNAQSLYMIPHDIDVHQGDRVRVSILWDDTGFYPHVAPISRYAWSRMYVLNNRTNADVVPHWKVDAAQEPAAIRAAVRGEEMSEITRSGTEWIFNDEPTGEELFRFTIKAGASRVVLNDEGVTLLELEDETDDE